MVYLYNRDARPEGVLGFSGCGRFFVRPGFSVFSGVFCLLSTVYCLLSSLAGGPEPVQRCGFLVVWCVFSVFLVSGAGVCPRTFLRFCLAVFIIFVNFAVFVNFSDNF